MQLRRAILLLLAASAAAAHGQPKPVEDLPGLFLDRSLTVRSAAPPLTEPRAAAGSEARGKRNTSSDDPAAQRRIVGIAKEQLARARSQARAGSAARLRLNLLAGVDMTAVIERTAPTSRGYSLAGHIAGMEKVSNVVLVVNGAVIVGDVWTPKGHYTIRAAGGGSYLIEKTDPADRKPLCEPILPPLEGSTRDTGRTSKDVRQPKDSGSTIDIFVFWTRTARLDAGGLRNMQAFVDLAIASANEAYLASDIQTRLNLVGATEVHYDYEGTDRTAEIHINHFIDPENGYMTEVHDVRDAYSADLVHLFFGSGVGVGGGIANIWGPFGISIMGGVNTFIHEVGHNMGLRHDAYTEGEGRFKEELARDDFYYRGYVNQRAFDAGAQEEQRWTTIMAYANQCDDKFFICPELLRFSNPRQRWPDDKGDPLGIAEGDGDWPADASRAVNESSGAVANWRQRSARCRFDLSGEVLEMPADGGSATIEVGTSGGASCPWHAVTNDAFVDLAVEDDRVVIRARANVGPSRLGVVSIAGRPVLLRQLGVVDHGDSRSDATRVSFPSLTFGAIDPGDDEDYFRFEVSARSEVVARTTGRLDTLGALYDADGERLATNDDLVRYEGDKVLPHAEHNFSIRRQLDAGAYYVRVSSWGTGTGAYALHLSVDHGDSPSDATRVSLPSQTSGVIDRASDEDYFRFEVSVRGVLVSRTTGHPDTVETLLDADGNHMGREAYSGEDYTSRHRAELDTGVYYVRVLIKYGGIGAYALHLNLKSAISGLENGGYRRTLGDFDGDGRDDVLLRHEDGRWFFYPMNGRRHMAGQGTANLTRNLEWSVAGVGDFDGDGKDDVLLRKAATGTWYYYPMDGRRHLSGHGAADLPSDLSWSVAGIGDFDGNGKDDVLMRHEDGRWILFPMNGRRVTTVEGDVDLTPNLEWSMAGIGDFDGDGKDDVLLRKAATTGAWYYYPMDGWRPLSGHGAADLPWDLSWSVAGIGDFDGNGKDDVLLRHEDGRWHFYPMNGRRVAAGDGRATLTGNLEWSVAGVGDLNGDGKDDVLLRKPATGAWYYYPMNGRRHLPERGGANLTSNRAWRGLFPIGGTSGGSSGAPTAATAIASRSLATGGDATLDLADHFSDDQTLVYEARSSDAEVVRVSVTGGVLTLMPVAAGSATVTVTARDPDGNEATQTFSVTVGPSVETFRDCDACPEMVAVPAGTFTMGAPYSEAGSRNRERPVHAVTVPSFAVGVYEVTFDEWDACVADGGCGGYRPHDVDWGRRGRPVINVSWNDAQSYVEWLSSRTGERYRLPSESEWEYAARAGTTTPFHTGETITSDQANYDGYWLYPSGASDPNGLYRGQTVPVGSFGANAWGLHDVHGNVWEWVQDCWNDGYEGAPADGSAWLSGYCRQRVLRGGSWNYVPSYLRAANRSRDATDRLIGRGVRAIRSDYIGFRVARTLAP